MLLDRDAQLKLDMESLHILPLRIFPLKIAGLRNARLVKDAHFRGMVELFSGQQSGSGLILPNQIGNVYEITEYNRSDVELVKKLAVLPSYDVYSLRFGLRKLEVDISDNTYLEISEEKKEQLQEYMNEFAKPLMRSIYGANFQSTDALENIVKLVDVENLEAAKENLIRLSKSLSLKIQDIPTFLQNYADVYLSVAYYKSCLDEHKDTIADFLETLSMVSLDPNLKYNANLVDLCVGTHSNMKASVDSISRLIDSFSAQTAEMWIDMPFEKFQKMQALIESYHTQLGGALCIIAVKMKLWSTRFPEPEMGGLHTRADFIMSDMRHGLEGLAPVQAMAA